MDHLHPREGSQRQNEEARSMSIQSNGLSKEERGAGAFRPLTITVQTGASMSGVSAGKIWQLIKANRLPIVRIDGRTLLIYSGFEQMFLTAAASDAPKKKMPAKRRAATEASTEVPVGRDPRRQAS
jgi:hypothetical protein